MENKKEKLLEILEKRTIHYDWEDYLAEKDPDFLEKFIDIAEDGFGEGVLSVKVKELIAIALLASRGEERGAIAHIKRAIENGATVDEIREAIEVSMFPCGAPALAHGLRALKKSTETE